MPLFNPNKVEGLDRTLSWCRDFMLKTNPLAYITLRTNLSTATSLIAVIPT